MCLIRDRPLMIWGRGLAKKKDIYCFPNYYGKDDEHPLLCTLTKNLYSEYYSNPKSYKCKKLF